jgi:excisionase family DNA binding protein
MARLMTVREAAEYLGVPVAYIYHAMRTMPGRPSHLRHVRLGRRRYTTQEWLEEWIGRVASEPEAPARSMRLVGETPLFEGAEGQ